MIHCRHFVRQALPISLNSFCILHGLPVLLARLLGQVSRLHRPVVNLTVLGDHYPMLDILLANRAHQGEVDDRRGLPHDERRYLALVRARQNIVEEQLLYPKASC